MKLAGRYDVVTIAVKLPEPIEAQIDATARRRGTTRSAIIREALMQFLGSPRHSGTVGEAARGIAGSVSGPRDLSTNPRHLRDYGS